MRKLIVLFSLTIAFHAAHTQKIDSISFNLYTDSLKKGFYNYISIDGKLSNGRWMPLSSEEVILTSNGGKFQGNDLFIDSSYTAEAVVVKAALKNNPAVWKEVTIYIRKRGFDEPLKSADEILNEMKKGSKKGKQRSA